MKLTVTDNPLSRTSETVEAPSPVVVTRSHVEGVDAFAGDTPEPTDATDGINPISSTAMVPSQILRRFFTVSKAYESCA